MRDDRQSFTQADTQTMKNVDETVKKLDGAPPNKVSEIVIASLQEQMKDHPFSPAEMKAFVDILNHRTHSKVAEYDSASGKALVEDSNHRKFRVDADGVKDLGITPKQETRDRKHPVNEALPNVNAMGDAEPRKHDNKPHRGDVPQDSAPPPRIELATQRDGHGRVTDVGNDEFTLQAKYKADDPQPSRVDLQTKDGQSVSLTRVSEDKCSMVVDGKKVAVEDFTIDKQGNLHIVTRKDGQIVNDTYMEDGAHRRAAFEPGSRVPLSFSSDVNDPNQTYTRTQDTYGKQAIYENKAFPNEDFVLEEDPQTNKLTPRSIYGKPTETLKDNPNLQREPYIINPDNRRPLDYT